MSVTACVVASAPSGCGGSEPAANSEDAVCTSSDEEWGNLLGSPCSPMNPCPEPLSCFYCPGCTTPHGHCERWALCSDAEILFYYCGCDGKDLEQSTTPYAYEGRCADAAADVASDR